MNKVKRFISKNVPCFALVLYTLFLIAVAVKIAASCSVGFADFFNRYISSVFRAICGHITSIFPFSLAETVIICALPVGVWFVLYYVRVLAENGKTARVFAGLIALVTFFYSSFVLNYATGYDGAPLEEKMNIEAETPTAEDLYNACAYTLAQANALESKVSFDSTGASRMPYDFSEMAKKLNEAYDTLYAEYAFLSPLHTTVKQIALSRPLTYTHMSGFYTFWSGEANVNVNYPDFIIVYTTAHEMAHQRGIAPEDEANFIAFLACAASDDPYIQYCGYANLFEYLGGALISADAELYRSQIAPFVGRGLAGEYIAYSEMFEPYADNAAADVSDAVNNAYLVSQGQSEGTKSYGLVVDLATAYLKTQY